MWLSGATLLFGGLMMLQLYPIHEFRKSYRLTISHNKRLVARSSSTKVFIHDMNTFETMVELKFSHPAVIKFTKDDNYFLIKGTTGTIGVYSTKDYQLLKKLKTTKSMQQLETEFSLTKDHHTILDVVKINGNQQIVSINMINGKKKALTDFTFKDHAIKFNQLVTKAGVHFFTLDYYDVNTGFLENKLIKIKERNENYLIEIENNLNRFKWDAIVYNHDMDKYLLLCNDALLMIDSGFRYVIKQVDVSKLFSKEELDYLSYISLSENGDFIIVTYSNKVLILDFATLELIYEETFPYACFAEFCNKDKHIIIGTWEKGHLFKTNL